MEGIYLHLIGVREREFFYRYWSKNDSLPATHTLSLSLDLPLSRRKRSFKLKRFGLSISWKLVHGGYKMVHILWRQKCTKTSDINPGRTSRFTAMPQSFIVMERGWTSGVKSKFACMPERSYRSYGCKKFCYSTDSLTHPIKLIWDIPGSQLEKRLSSEKTLKVEK